MTRIGRRAGVALLALIALAACAGTPPASTTPTSAPVTPPAPASSATVEPSTWAPPTRIPTTSPTAPPAGTPSPGAGSPGPEPSLPPVSPVVVARVVSFPDVFAAPVPPDITVYADGRVMTPGWRTPGFETVRFIVRRLTADGLAQVLAAFGAAVPAGGEIGARDPGQGAGYATYEVSVLRDGALMTATTTNASKGAGVRNLVAFAESWWTPQDRVATAGWAVQVPVPYRADRWTMWAWLEPDCCSEPGAPDAARVVEPVTGLLARFGRVPNPANPTGRCAVIKAVTRSALATALTAAGRPIGDGLDRADVTLNLGRGSVSLTLVPLLPEIADCATEVG
ncbi:MAG: hypothetical protein WCK58_05735 [Chloroflexota bacterium]